MSHLLDINSGVDHLSGGPASEVTVKLAAAPPGSVYLCSRVATIACLSVCREAQEASDYALLPLAASPP